MEKNRRLQLKDLVSRLATLIPAQPSNTRLSLPVVLDQATTYVKQQRENIEELKKRKEKLKGGEKCIKDDTASSMFPALAVRDMGSALEVNLITGLNNKVLLHEVLRVLEEEGAEAVSASYSIVGDKIFYTMYYRAIYSRIGIETSRVHERLNKLVF